MSIYQFKIDLKHIKPAITRTILVEEDTSFDEFAQILMTAFNWSGGHLWQFSYNTGGRNFVYISTPDEEMDEDIENMDASEVLLSELYENEKIKIQFEYDFGDSWEHTIKLEKVLEKDKKLTYPVCTKGARNTPPEDCGSYPGYEEMLAHYADPKKFKKEIREFEEWFGDKYDPEYFNLEELNEALQ
ncbi:MAG: plasmid pRiA4b ORF-3 family protein [Cytophagales bacterium]|nr:MAG: plasmid pRiA4b ORF-3 family protein [Cytophagales bacterium]